MITIKHTDFTSNVSLPAILSLVEKTGKVPSYKELRMLAFLNELEQ